LQSVSAPEEPACICLISQRFALITHPSLQSVPEVGILGLFYPAGHCGSVAFHGSHLKMMTTIEERKIRMTKGRKVTKLEKILFPLVSTFVIILLVPASAPLIAMFMLGNLFRESGVVERLNHAAQNELLNIVTIFLGLPVGATMNAENFLQPKVIFIFILGLLALCCELLWSLDSRALACFDHGNKNCFKKQ